MSLASLLVWCQVIIYIVILLRVFPKSYALIWIAFTVLSPFLAHLCWYAKGNGWIACIISACIIGTLFNTAFSYGFFYFFVRYWLEVIVLLLMIVILRRKSKEMFVMLGMGIIFAVIANFLLPSEFGKYRLHFAVMLSGMTAFSMLQLRQ